MKRPKRVKGVLKCDCHTDTLRCTAYTLLHCSFYLVYSLWDGCVFFLVSRWVYSELVCCGFQNPFYCSFANIFDHKNGMIWFFQFGLGLSSLCHPSFGSGSYFVEDQLWISAGLERWLQMLVFLLFSFSGGGEILCPVVQCPDTLNLCCNR